MLKARSFNFLGIPGLVDATNPEDFRLTIGAEESGAAADSLLSHVNSGNPHTQYQLAATAFDGLFESLGNIPDTLVGYGITDAATSAQGALADSALQPGDPVPQSDVTGLVSNLAAKADLVGGLIPTSQIPAIAISEYLGSVPDEAAMLALIGQSGDWCTRQDTASPWMLSSNDPTQLGNWIQFVGPPAPVISVNGQTQIVVLGKANIGLPNVDDTSDIDKPISTATQAALNLKAPLASPTFTGTPSAPTAATSNNTTQLATTAFVQAVVNATKESLYPVGSVYINAQNATNPATLLGFGTWSAFGAGRVPVGFDGADPDFDTAEKIGGEKDHTLNDSEMPTHSHPASAASVADHVHNIGGALGAGTGYIPEVGGFGTGAAFGTGGRRSGSVTASNGAHGHTITVSSSGDGEPHNNLQPYVTVYMWKRTA